MENIKTALKYAEEAIDIYRKLRLKADLSRSLNNASKSYYAFSSMQQTQEEKLRSIRIALKYAEEAIEIQRDLGLRADLCRLLNNASNFYTDLSFHQGTQEEKLRSIKTALKYAEEAVRISRDLGLKFDLSISLNHLSRIYFVLSTLTNIEKERKKLLDIAIKHIENAIEIGRELGLILNLGIFLTLSVSFYDSYIEFDPTVLQKAMNNCDEAINIFLSFGRKKDYYPLLFFGLKYHYLLYVITKSPEHQAIITMYKLLLNQSRT